MYICKALGDICIKRYVKAEYYYYDICFQKNSFK